jgi:hypothetical protein
MSEHQGGNARVIGAIMAGLSGREWLGYRRANGRAIGQVMAGLSGR